MQIQFCEQANRKLFWRKIKEDLCSDNLKKAHKAGGSFGYLNQEANDNPINEASFNPLLKTKNIRLSHVNMVIISNLMINSPQINLFS